MMKPDETPLVSLPAKRHEPQLKRWWRMLIFLGLTVLIWAGVVLGLQRQLLFPRWVIPEAAQRTPGVGVETWWLETEAGRVEGWFLPGENVTTDKPGPAVIFAHGNGELIDFWVDEWRAYQQRGISVLLPEYRGYGRSAGSPSQEAITRDLTAFYDRLVADDRIDSEHIILHGRSVGGGVVAQLAAVRPSAGMILESTFTSVRPLAAGYLVPPFMVRDPLDTLMVVQDYEQPVLILHGRSDTIIPLHHAESLYAASQEGELMLFDDVGHNDPMPAELYWQTIDAWLKQLKILRTNRPKKTPPAEAGGV